MTCPDRPLAPNNRPGLPALRYRIGDYASFRDRLLSRLTCDIVVTPQGISLRQLKTRAQDDPAIALLDAVAVVADVLTFYQERIINEGYLLTATERQSVLELARMIGYELDPGVAASALLAFTVENTPDSPKTAIIAKGTQVLSIPEQDELPQAFETSTDFTAHVEWNALKPRPARPQKLTEKTNQLFLQGTSTGLQPGDTLLLLDGEDESKPYYLLTLDRVVPNTLNGYTLVAWVPQRLDPPPLNPRAIAFRQRTNLFGFNAPRWDTVSDDIKLAAGSKVKGGVSRASDASFQPLWQAVNQGLLNFDIRCLAVSAQGALLAGTPIGLFRSTNNGETWLLSNSGLTNFNIQTIATTPELLVGTPSGGVFRSTDEGETWAPIGTGSIAVSISGSPPNQVSTPKSTGIPNTVVRSIVSATSTLATPTLSVFDLNPPIANSAQPGRGVQITRGATIVPLTLQVNDRLVVGNEVRTIDRIFATDPTIPTAPIEVGVDAAFTTAPAAGSSFFAYRPTEGAAVFSALLFAGNTGSHLFAATDVGVYWSNDQGKNWYGNNSPAGLTVWTLAATSSSLFARTDNGIYRSTDQGANWILTNLTPTGRTIRSLIQFSNDVFAAASDGVWQWSNSSWVPFNTGLPPSLGVTTPNVWSIAVNNATGNLFSFTKEGVFQAKKSTTGWDNWSNWSQPIDQGLQTVTACAKSGAGASSFVFAGAAFTGFTGEGEAGWRNFHLPAPEPGDPFQVDLSTTNTKLLVESWILLQIRDRHQLCRVKAIEEVQRRNFMLDSKIARISTDTFIDQPEQIDLRDTIVLAQSELLPLRDEPLTVTVQQANIFFDPIWDNKVLLDRYVSGLLAQHPVVVSGKRMSVKLLNAGGIVQQVPQPGDPGQWVRSNTGLTHTNVTAFAAHTQVEQGTIANDPTAIRGTDTVFTAELKIGLTLIEQSSLEQNSLEQSSQATATIKAIYSDTSLSTATAFNPANTAFKYRGEGTGTIASQGTVVTGSKTLFTQELKVGIELILGDQRVTVTQIDSDTALTIASALSSDLPPGTPFTYEGTGTGTIQNDRTALRGTTTAFTQALSIGQAISINRQTYRIRRIISEDLLFLFVDADVSVTEAPFSSSVLFTGTEGGGVFRSIDNGNTWEPINQGLTILAIQAIAVRSIASPTQVRAQPSREGYQLFVGTAIGIFQTEPTASATSKIAWKQINQNLAYSDVRSLLYIPATGTHPDFLLMGTINGGVLRLIENLSEPPIWNQVGLSNTDVQTLILAPNGDIFAGTVGDRVFRGIVRTHSITWQPLERGLTDHPNVTSVASYQSEGLGTVTTIDKMVIGNLSSTARTAFTTEFCVGDTITIGNQTRRVQRVISDLQLELDTAITPDVVSSQSFQVARILLGTPGSGVFRLKPDPDQLPTWEPVANNPADLNVLCLTVDPKNNNLFAGTASGGIFRSIDDGNLWTEMNVGLTSLDRQVNPAAKVNTEFRTLTFVNQTLFAAGIGILISPDNLYTIPIRAGDRLEVMAPPVPLPQKGRELTETIEEQRWLLSDRDSFLGVVLTAQATDIELQPAAADAVIRSEQHTIALPPQDQQEPLLSLLDPIQNSYDPQTVQIYANVIAATQGETIREVLGNGDSTLTHQTFNLKKPPLTYISATTPSGTETTLQVRVNEVLWQEVPSLYQQSPSDQVYIARIADDRSVTLTFGNGMSGTRLPTGLENITASYRSGIGLAGLVGADRLSLLKTRPLGIAQVTNPLPATGAAEPETMNEARTSAPLTVRTLDRIVSLQDYEDFARAFAGIGKAQSDLLLVDGTPLVHITVAAIGGGNVLPGTALYTHLVQAVDASRDPVQQVRITSFEAIAFNLEAKLLVDPRYLAERVTAAARTALLNRFTFEQRSFGQAVTAAEAIATLQAVEGIIAVDLDVLHRRDRTRSLEQSVAALAARWQPATREILPAQLLVINPAGILLHVEATL